MKYLVICLFAAVSILQAGTWTVSATHPHLSRYHNSVEVQKGDSTLIIQFDFSTGKFPAKGDTVELMNNRKGLKDGAQIFDIINIFKVSK